MGRVTIIGSLVGILVVLLGGVYNLANTVAGVNDRLDRNLNEITRLQVQGMAENRDICLALKQLDFDLRFHVFEKGEDLKGIRAAVDC